mgnify:CR=1 FL=1|jgi:hypothetical protein|tara:strand:+ start:5626 stop:6312 length:687 start_codon:yes stop_codon:yes gene_type:complete
MEIYYSRTLALMEALSIDSHLFLNRLSFAEKGNFLKIETEPIWGEKKLTRLNHKRLNEIFSIEQEKYFLRDNIYYVKEIRKIEISQSKIRSIILNKPFSDLLKIKFVLNPFVSTYESDWKWIVRHSYTEVFNLKNILDVNEKDYYFLFKRTGVYDSSLGTNILEFPLSDCSYFLLRLFESPNSLMKASARFLRQFELVPEDEKKQIQSLTESLITELMFRMFIIPYQD